MIEDVFATLNEHTERVPRIVQESDVFALPALPGRSR
jgi:hypothetical protein